MRLKTFLWDRESEITIKNSEIIINKWLEENPDIDICFALKDDFRIYLWYKIIVREIY